MLSWILSKLFPPSEPIYHIHRRETKKIPIIRNGISAFGMPADKLFHEVPHDRSEEE